MARCRGCGQEITWIKMKTGKSMPVDPERIMYWDDENGKDVLVTPDGETVTCSLTGDINHRPDTGMYHTLRPARPATISGGEENDGRKGHDQ